MSITQSREVVLSFVDLAPVVKPSDVNGLPYAPTLLLDAHLPASVKRHDEFAVACQYGYEAYFDGMVERVGDEFQVEDFQFVDYFFTSAEVTQSICRFVLASSDCPLVWNVGFSLGWLSALALVDRVLAVQGVELLCTLVELIERPAARRRAS